MLLVGGCEHTRVVNSCEHGGQLDVYNVYKLQLLAKYFDFVCPFLLCAYNYKQEPSNEGCDF